VHDSSDLLSSERLVILLEHHSSVLLQHLLTLPSSLPRKPEEIQIGEDVFWSMVGEEDEELGSRGRARETAANQVGVLGVVEDLKNLKRIMGSVFDSLR